MAKIIQIWIAKIIQIWMTKITMAKIIQIWMTKITMTKIIQIWMWDTCISILLYGRKLLTEKTFRKFHGFVAIRKSFLHEIWGVAF